jgi:hypothetical protein
MATYLANAVRDQLDQAQAELERHLVTGADGRCLGCGQVEPCAVRGHIEAVFRQYGRLPQRRPGVTKAGLRQPTVTDGGSWFTK